MLDITLLGTGGMMPLPRRWVTSLLVRYNGASLLVDCGEGTQIALREKGWSFKPVNTILLTHFHADHIAGLPGFFLTMGNSDRTEPVTVIGPRGLSRIMTAVRTIAPELPFEVNFIEIDGNEQTFLIDGMEITAFRVQHNIVCYAYEISVRRKGRFDAARAKAQEIPLRFWNPLQRGETIEDGARIYTPEMVLGEERKGLKVVFTGDTALCDSLVSAAAGADLMICEATYGDNNHAQLAAEYGHMVFAQAAEAARRAGVKRLWLTHYSQVVEDPQIYRPNATAIFENAVCGEDGMSTTLHFGD